ncbi:MAG: alanine racemase [Clostridium sp.]|nr:alanine racemase [Clostridium sp.]
MKTEQPYKRIYAEIHLDRIIKNMEAMAAGLPEGTRMLGVVKADGYGHGSVPVAKAIDPFVWGYAVAAIEEGIILRKHGIEKPILILGNTHRSHFKELLEYEIRPALFETEKAEELSQLAVSLGRKALVHLAVDTGMSRIGLFPDETGVDAAVRIAALPGIEVEGLFTHFSRADEGDPEYTDVQFSRYGWFADRLKESGIRIPICHCANSAAIMELPQMSLDAVRAGISMYGIYPSDEVSHEMKLEPAMEIRSFITYIKEIAPGTPVSYGGTFVAEKRMRVATVAAGYGDGYPRSLSGRGYVVISGKRAPILGRVCMDQFMVDVTDIPEAETDGVVTLVGRDGGEALLMEQLADLCGGFRYEIPCVLGKRVPRVYLNGGQMVGTKDYYTDVYEDFR